MPNLQCSTGEFDGLIVVAAVGDVDMVGSDALWEELSARLAPASVVALDCTGVTFMDSMGLQTLLRAHQHATDQQGCFVLVGANRYLDRVLELTGMTGLIPNFADVETARLALGSAAAG